MSNRKFDWSKLDFRFPKVLWESEHLLQRIQVSSFKDAFMGEENTLSKQLKEQKIILSEAR